jgi:hypothetical protein
MHDHGISRRALLQGAMGAGAAVVASGVIGPGAAYAAEDPRPKAIPGGFLPIAHVNGPGPAPPSTDPAAIDDDSTIYDFDGVLVTSHIQGTGTGTDLTTGLDVPLSFDTDQRFMQGHYVAEDGVTRYGTFGFI